MDNLAKTCKLLLDREYLKLKQEHELLKKEYYISLHRVAHIVRMVRKSNMYGTHAPRCVCKECFYCTRTMLTSPISTGTGKMSIKCTFEPWISGMARSCGVITQVGIKRGDRVSTFDELYGRVCSAPAHIVFINGRLDWDFFAYGSLVSEARSLDDIKPLVDFISQLETLTNIPYQHDMAYRPVNVTALDLETLQNMIDEQA